VLMGAKGERSVNNHRPSLSSLSLYPSCIAVDLSGQQQQPIRFKVDQIKSKARDGPQLGKSAKPRGG
jgi:hypothetical protein